MNNKSLVGLMAIFSVALALSASQAVGIQASVEGDSSFQVDIQSGGNGTTFRTDGLSDFSYLSGGK